MSDQLLVLSVFAVASCGLAYELVSGALSSYLLGDSVLQFSTVIGCYLFAMGVGSHLSRYVRDERALASFVEIELAIGLFGGLSAALLFAVYAWLSTPFRAVLYSLVFVVGVLVGMEIPLVMRVMHRRETRFADVVSRVLTFDYLGALAVSLLFPLVLAPWLGLVRTALLFGLVNATVALLTARVCRADMPHPRAFGLRAGIVLAVLLGGLAAGDRFTAWSEHHLFGDEVVHAQTTPYQRIVVTRWHDDTRLYLNGNLQFSSRDEHRYHEALVHPALQAMPWARSALVMGGGDGLALREILRHPNVEQVTLVDLDPAMTALFADSPALVRLNAGALRDRRVRVLNDDAARWLEQSESVFDLIVADFPDPSNYGLGKLFSVPFYRLMTRHLSEHGYAVIQATSPYFAPHAYWCIESTLREAGLHTWPYHVYVPSFGEWGFVLAGRRPDFEIPTHFTVPLRFLDGPAAQSMFVFPPDMPRLAMEPNRLNTQALVRYFERDWRDVLR